MFIASLWLQCFTLSLPFHSCQDSCTTNLLGATTVLHDINRFLDADMKGIPLSHGHGPNKRHPYYGYGRDRPYGTSSIYAS